MGHKLLTCDGLIFRTRINIFYVDYRNNISVGSGRESDKSFTYLIVKRLNQA